MITSDAFPHCIKGLHNLSNFEICLDKKIVEYVPAMPHKINSMGSPNDLIAILVVTLLIAAKATNPIEDKTNNSFESIKKNCLKQIPINI